MSRNQAHAPLTLGEWWAVYCLRFGASTVDLREYVEGEQELVTLVAELLELCASDVIEEFREMYKEENLRASKPE